MGLAALAAASALLGFLRRNQATVDQFQSQHPGATVAAVFIAGWLIVYLLDGVAVFLTATALPVLLVLTHASLRMRGLKNKLNETLESSGLKRSPMALLLDAIQVEMEKAE